MYTRFEGDINNLNEPTLLDNWSRAVLIKQLGGTFF